MLAATLVSVTVLAIRGISLAQDSHNGILLFGSSQNVGIVKSSDPIRIEITALNLGLNPVSISGEPDCGCMVAGNYDHTILPFGLISVPIKISTDGVKKGPHARALILNFKTRNATWRRSAVIRFSTTNEVN